MLSIHLALRLEAGRRPVTFPIVNSLSVPIAFTRPYLLSRFCNCHQVTLPITCTIAFSSLLPSPSCTFPMYKHAPLFTPTYLYLVTPPLS